MVRLKISRGNASINTRALEDWGLIQRVHYTARRCAENGFDFCLELSGTSRGTRRYYSKKEWSVKSDDPETVRSLLPAVLQPATATH